MYDSIHQTLHTAVRYSERGLEGALKKQDND